MAVGTFSFNIQTFFHCFLKDVSTYYDETFTGLITYFLKTRTKMDMHFRITTVVPPFNEWRKI